MGITIKDVAEKVGVSKTTISFYLNNKFEYMSEETKKKIMIAIEELNYKPSAIAQGLKTKKSGLIGMIVADISNSFTSILVKGVNDKCVQEGFQLIIANTDNDEVREKEYINSMLQRQVEGIIINTTGKSGGFIKDLKKKGVKIVLTDRELEEVTLDTIVTNNEEVTIELMEGLYKKGIDEIALFTYPLEKNSTRIKRYESFKQMAIQKNKSSNENVYIEEENGSFKKAIKEYMDTYKGVKKVAFIVNGVAMLNFIKSTKMLGVVIPEELKVCGFDDWGWNCIVENGITTIAQPSYEVGMKSAELLINRIKENILETSPIKIELKGQIKYRNSTKI